MSHGAWENFRPTAKGSSGDPLIPAWRLVLFRVLALLLGLAYLPGAVLLILPWISPSALAGFPNLSPLIWSWTKAAHPELQRWAFAFSACIDEALAAILLFLAARPLGASRLIQLLLGVFIIAVCANVPFFGPGIVIAYSLLLLVVVTYPQPRTLLTGLWKARVSWPSLALAVVALALFVPQVWTALQAQILGVDSLSKSFAWASIVEHSADLWLILLFASFRGKLSVLLTPIIAVCCLYLGLASLSLPSDPGSWGRSGGTIAIIGGAAYVAIAAYEGRRSPAPPK